MDLNWLNSLSDEAKGNGMTKANSLIPLIPLFPE